MAESITAEAAASWRCPIHGVASPASITQQRTCLMCGSALEPNEPVSLSKGEAEFVPEPERTPVIWTVIELEEDGLYDLEEDGRAMLLNAMVDEIEQTIEDEGGPQDEIILIHENGLQEPYEFRTPPRW